MNYNKSHSLRSAWIEIEKMRAMRLVPEVALLTECVDRNVVRGISACQLKQVALLTECVDRNFA